jgi:hypothetical protein
MRKRKPSPPIKYKSDFQERGKNERKNNNKEIYKAEAQSNSKP